MQPHTVHAAQRSLKALEDDVKHKEEFEGIYELGAITLRTKGKERTGLVELANLTNYYGIPADALCLAIKQALVKMMTERIQNRRTQLTEMGVEL